MDECEPATDVDVAIDTALAAGRLGRLRDGMDLRENLERTGGQYAVDSE